MNFLRKKVARLSGIALVATGLVLTAGFQSPASASQIVKDGGFEAAVDDGSGVLDSPFWTEADSLFDSPLCNEDLCGTGGGASPPRTGAVWAWFGGAATAGQTGSLTQSTFFPSGGTASLTYWYRNGTVAAPFDATLVVKVDGTTVKTHTEAAVAEAAYTLQTVDVSAFANGANHTLSFNYTNGGAGTNSMVVDDVAITTSVNLPVTATPTVTSTDPASPSGSTTPKVKGTAEAGSTVTLYSNATCTGAALGSGTAADFAGAGITAAVPNNATTTIYAKATKAAQEDSACSTTFVSYVNDSTVPNTTITSPAAGAVVKSLTVPVTFTSSEAGSTFTCKVDTAAFAPCTSPASLTVTSGQHTVQVVAKDTAGNADASPASVTFTAYDCTSLNAAVTSAQTKVDAAGKAVAKAKKALKKAKKSHNASKIKKAKKKLKKAKAAQKAAQSALAAAQASAAPCGGTSMKLQAVK